MLRQQSYAIKNQLVAKTPPTRGISCSSLVLYGIRIVGFHARKGPSIGANENAGYISLQEGRGRGQLGDRQGRLSDPGRRTGQRGLGDGERDGPLRPDGRREQQQRVAGGLGLRH